MRFKGTIFLSALLIFLASYLYFVELPGDGKKRAEAIKKAKLFSFEMSEITRVRIKSAKNEIELEYFPGHPENPWRIFDPVETVANERAGDEIAAFLTELKASRLVEERPTNLKDFGLDPPLYTVIITLQKNDTEIVEVGSPNLTGSDVYIRIGEGTSLYLVRAGIKNILNKDLTGWRRQEIFPYEPQDIKGIQLISVDGLMNLKRDEQGWSMQINRVMDSKPQVFRADRNEVANLLGSLLSLRGEHFIDKRKDALRARLAPPIMKVRLQVSQVEREASFYADPESKDIIDVVASPMDPIFKMQKKELKVLQQAFQIYRDKALLSLSFPGEIERLEIMRPNEYFVLEKKKDGRWWLENGDGEKKPLAKQIENTDLIAQVLGDLFNMRLEQFLDGLNASSPETGLSEPQLSLHLQGRDGKALGEIVFGEIKGDLLYAKSTIQPGLFFLSKDMLEKIPHRKDFKRK